ncbi:hypothetical protein [Pseudogracilibacillus sp. SO30301A]|uniref:hypothetical protein n=1 Tax=Pseudogracilibacillus sp. SO30301A TaxID=3098291 RepID=UPI00300E3162
MASNLVNEQKHGIISYLALFIGIVCFFIVFITPTRIANIGHLYGDYITFALTAAGIALSFVGILKKTEKNVLPIIALILSSSFFIYWIIIILLLFSGVIEFGP